MPIYESNGKKYNIPEDKVNAFLSSRKDAQLVDEAPKQGDNASSSPRQSNIREQQGNDSSGSAVNQGSEPQNGGFDYTSMNIPNYTDQLNEPKIQLGNGQSLSDAIGIALQGGYGNGQQSVIPVRGFGEGFEQGTKALKEGTKVSGANIANTVTGSARDAERALGILDKYGDTPSDYKPNKAYRQDIQDRYKSDMDAYKSDMDKWYEKHPSILGKMKGMLPIVGDKPSEPDNPNVLKPSLGDLGGLIGDRVDMRPYNLVEEALKQGDIEQAKNYLREKAGQKTWGDEVEADAIRELATLRPTEGIGAWVGNLTPQMIPNALAIVSAVHPSTRALAKPLAHGGMGILSLSSGGSAIADARQYAAETGMDIPESTILEAGALSTAIEIVTEKIPLDRYMSGAGSLVKKRIGNKVTKEIVRNPAAQKELKTFFTRAVKELPGVRSITSQTAKKFAGDVMTEGLSEFSAESLGAMVPMLYAYREDYPTLMEILDSGIEGFKGGIFMGGMLGGGSHLTNNLAQNQRRKQEGSITLMDTGDGIVELLGMNGEMYTALNPKGEVVNISPAAIKDTHIVGWDEFKDFAKESRENSLENGAYTKLEASEKRIIKDSFRQAERKFDGAFANTPISAVKEEVLNASAEQQQEFIVDVANMDDLTDEQKSIAIDYVVRGNAYNSYQSSFNDILDTASQEIAEYIEGNENPSTKSIMTVTIAGHDNPVQVVKGNIIRNEDGSINRDQSDQMITYSDSEGNRKPISIKHIEDVAENISTQDAISQAVEYETAPIIAQQMNDEVRLYAEGEEVRVTMGDMSVLGMITGMDDSGRYLFTDAITQQQMPIDPIQIVNEDNLLGIEQGMQVRYIGVDGNVKTGIMNDLYSQRMQGNVFIGNELVSVESVIGMVETSQQSSVNSHQLENSQVSGGVEEQNEQIVTQTSEEQGASSYMDQIAKGEKGELLFELSPIDVTVGALQEVYNDPKELRSVIEATIANNSKQIEKLQAPKPTGDMVKDIANKQKANAQIADLSSKVDYWNEVLSSTPNAEVQQKEFSFKERLDAVSENVSELHDIILHGIASGAYKFKWTGSKNTPGLSQELGLDNSRAEMRSRINILSNKGFTPETLAHRIWEDTGGRYETDDIRNEILDILQSIYTRSETLASLENRLTLSYISEMRTQEQYAYELELERQAEERISEIMDELNEADLENLINIALVNGVSLSELDNVHTATDIIDLIEQLENGQQEQTSDTIRDNSEDKTSDGEGSTIEGVDRNVSERNESSKDRGIESENKSRGKNGLNILKNDRQEISKRVPQRANRSQAEIYRTLETASMDNRSGEGAASEARRTKAHPREQKQRLKELAIEQGSWIEDTAYLGEKYTEGGENEVLYDSRSNKIHKLNNFEYAGDNIYNLAIRLEAHNILFPESKYNLIGFAENSKGEISAVLDQDFVQSSREATPEEIRGYMESQGFKTEDEDTFSNKEYMVFDASPNNVLMGIDGNLYFIDTQIKNKAQDKSLSGKIEKAEAETDTNPTDGQKAAGNYRKGKVSIQGFNVTIEQPKGSERSGTDESGNAWSVTMQNTYGYIRGTEGKDGDHIDIFLGNNPDSQVVYVVDQMNDKGEFDEHKVMFGFDSLAEARDAYLSNYEQGWQGMGEITGVDIESFRKWTDSDSRKIKPFAEYKQIQDTPTQKEVLSKVKQRKKDGKYVVELDRRLSQTPLVLLARRAKIFNGKWEKKSNTIVFENESDAINFREAESKLGRNAYYQSTPTRFAPIKESKFNDLVDRLKQTGLAKDVITDKESFDKKLSEVIDNDAVAKQMISEMESIKQESIANNTFMLAPNGEQTNLSETQWLQVRTTNFKNWFGDWVNDPANASKVVDENGEPMVVYHRSEENFTEFDKSKIGSHTDSGVWGRGFYFSKEDNMPSHYGNNLIESYLNIKKPITLNSKEDMNRFGKEYTKYAELFENGNPSIEEYTKFYTEGGLEQSYDKATSDFIDSGYDGVIIEDDEFVSFSPTQIKSSLSNNGEFSVDNADIRMQLHSNSANTNTELEYLRNLEYIDTNKTNSDSEKIVYVPKYKTHYDYAENTDPLIESFDSIDASLNDVNIVDSDYRNRSSKHYIPTKWIRMYLVEAHIDEYGDIIESDNTIDINELDTFENNILVQNIPDIVKSDGILETNTFTSREDSAINLEAEISSRVNKDIESVQFGNYTAKVVGNGKYRTIYLVDKNGNDINSITLRIADHSYNPKNNLRNTSDDFISLTIANKNETIDIYRGGKNIHLDGNDTYDGAKSQLFDRLEEIAYRLDTHFMHAQGEVYGFVTPEGEVYLDSTRMNANTPIHEFGHLWNTFTKENNTELYNRGAELVQGSEYWGAVNSNPTYANLSQEAKIDEALAMAIGDKGESIVKEQGLKTKLKKWISDVWSWLGDKFNISPKVLQDMTLDEFTNVAVAELLEGKKLSQKNRAKGIDEAYFKAIENNDLQSAQRIIDNLARAKGYISDNDFRMNHTAPNREDQNMVTLMEDSVVPSDYWTHPKYYQYESDEFSSFYSVKRAIEKYKEKGRSYISMYRAVPKDVKEDKFRNGDWISPSKEYARSEGEGIVGGYRIIGIKVPIQDVWWDVNSINEFGYDDGKKYAYKNTRNNRKLQDPITYDYDGNIIPPSKRFNYREYDTRFQSVNNVSDIAEANNSRMTEEMRIELDSRLKNKLFKIREAWEDKHLAIKEFLDVLRENGTEVAEHNDYYLQATHVNGKVDAQLEHYRNTLQKPLNKAIRDIQDKGIEYRAIENYAILKHGLERNVWMRENAIKEYMDKHPDAKQSQIDRFIEKLPEDFAGVLVVEEEVGKHAEWFINDIEEKVGQQLVDNLWKRVKDASQYSLKKQLEGGLISRKTLDEFSTRYDYYIPLRGHDDTVAEDRWDYTPHMGTYFVNPIMKANGRRTRAEKPFAFIAQQAQSSINSSNRNILNQTLLRLANQDKTGLMGVNKGWYQKIGEENGIPVFEIRSPEYSPRSEIYAKNIEEFEARMEKLAEQGLAVQSGSKLDIGGMFIKRNQSQQHEVQIFQNGTEYIMYINANPAVAQAMNGTNISETPKMMKPLAKMSRFMAANFTTRNPMFVMTNFSRDYLFASSILPVKENVKYALQFQKNIPTAAGALQRYLRGKSNLSQKQDQYLMEYILGGAKTGFSHILEIQKVQKEIEKDIKKGDKRNALEKALGVFGAANEFAENLSRLSVYITSREQGRSQVRSVADAKEVTVNFNRSGAGGYGANVIRPMYLFVNAGLQSISNFAKVAIKNPSKTAALMSSYVMTGALLAPMLAQLLGGDEGEEEYMKLGEWERQNNFCIYTGKGFIKIPLSHELRVFHRLGDQIYHAAKGSKDWTEAFIDGVLGFSDLIPIDPAGAVDASWAELMPDFAKPIAQLEANKNFMGSRIYNEWANPNTPGYLKARTNRKGDYFAPAFLVRMTQALDNATGGDGVEQGLVSINPDIVEHFSRGYLGGLYSLGMQGVDMASKVGEFADTGDFKLKVRDTPLKTFFASSDDLRLSSSALNSKYFKITDEIKDIRRKVKGYEDQLDEYMDKVKDGKMSATEFTKKQSEIGAKIDNLDEDKALDVYSIIKEINDWQKDFKDLSDEEQKEAEAIISELKEEAVNMFEAK